MGFSTNFIHAKVLSRSLTHQEVVEVFIVHELSFLYRKSLHRRLGRAPVGLFLLLLLLSSLWLLLRLFHVGVAIADELRDGFIHRAVECVDAHEARQEAHDAAAIRQQLVRLASTLLVEQLL